MAIFKALLMFFKGAEVLHANLFPMTLVFRSMHMQEWRQQIESDGKHRQLSRCDMENSFQNMQR